MVTIISLHGKYIRVELTNAAHRALNMLTEPLVAEIHLIFGCLVVKRVWFKPASTAELTNISGNLYASFRTVRYAKHCRLSHIDSGEEQPSDYQIVLDKKTFVPHWLRIDYRRNKWIGTHGYDRSIGLESNQLMLALSPEMS